MTTPSIAKETPAPQTRVTVRSLIWIFIIIGILISGYLTGIKFTEEPLAQQLFGIEPQTMVCLTNGVFDCGAVQNSVYAEFMGIPIAYLGLAMYLSLAIIMGLEKRIALLRQNAALLMFGITLFAWVYSMYLVYLQVVVLRALCQWCLMHELNITVLFPLVSYQLWQQWKSDNAEA